MGVHQKTFKIGEYAVGGIVVLTIYDHQIVVECKDWDSKETILRKIFTYEPGYYSKIEFWLEDEVTSYYYADRIVSWLKEFHSNEAVT